MAAWGLDDAPPPGLDVAERLGLWLTAFDAIGLQAAHQAIGGIQEPMARRSAPPRLVQVQRLAEDLQRLRATLAAAVAQPVDEATPAAFQQRQQKLQRDMELMIGPLRDHARQLLAGTSARLRRLAALDAAMQQVLAAREQKVLPAVGLLLERRQRELRRLQPDGDGWLETFRTDWQQALLAELELRLEPVAGLVAALHNESNDQP